MVRQKITICALVKHQTYGVGIVETLQDSGGAVVAFGDGETLSLGPSVAANLRVLPEDVLEARIWQSPKKWPGGLKMLR